MAWKIILIAFFSLIPDYYGLSQEEQKPLVVHIINFKSSEGNGVVRLYRESDDLPKHSSKQFAVPIIGEEATVSIDSLPYGNYALIVFHDKNSNNEVDHFLGLPSEPLGFSNDWHLGLFSGMPTFKKLAIAYSQQLHKVTIELR